MSEHQLIADRYRLERSLGAGGMGQVWSATDTMLGRPVAVKAVTLGDDEALRARVMREARAAARIDDAGSVRVFDVVDEGHTVHIVMELVEAPTLAEVVAERGPLVPAQAARVGLDVLGALAAAHRAGIVHRDVKPNNVMLLPDGRAKLADFGIASVKDDPSITSTGMVLGTPKYMSPEQARGEIAGAPADLWGLGALLYFAAEGEAPFDRGEALPTLNAVLHDEPRPFQRADGLAPVIERLLAKDPERRPGDEETRRLLLPVAGGEAAGPATTVVASAPPTMVAPAPAPGTPPTRRPVAPPPVAPRDRRWLGALALVAAVALVAALALALSDDDEEPVAGGAPTTTTEAPTTTAPSTTTTTAPSTTTTAAGSDRPAGVPGDWVRYEGPSYAVWHPDGWTPAAGPAGSVDITGPGGGYLRVDTVDDPGDDAVAAWEAQEAAFQAEHPDYRRQRIEAVDYRDYEAAIWEYTFEGRRAANLGFTDGETGWALNLVRPEDSWDEDVWEAIQAGFEER